MLVVFLSSIFMSNVSAASMNDLITFWRRGGEMGEEKGWAWRKKKHKL